MIPSTTPYLMLRKISRFCFVILVLMVLSTRLSAQVQASGYGFNYFTREWFDDPTNGAGYSFYAAVWPIMQKYPGPENFQLGLPSTWMTPEHSENLPEGFYNTIEGGLGWWGDSRFATETPKFIMGGVANGFSQWANGTGAGSGPLLASGHRDWSVPGGKYGVAQLSQNVLWPPDGLNMEQGANGEFFGYGYHPLPLTEVMDETKGVNFSTGNQSWTLFVNTKNHKGPIAFFIPTFWTETALDESNLEGLFLDASGTDKNQAFAIEYAESPALIGMDNSGNTYARILPLVFPATTSNRSEVIREIKVYSKNAKWNEVEDWFNGGKPSTTAFQTNGIQDVFFSLDHEVDGNISTENGSPVNAKIDFAFAKKESFANGTVAGFEWDSNVVTNVDGKFIMPSFYKLSNDNSWEPISSSEVPSSTGLLDKEPVITPRNDQVPYLTPLEPDCPFQDSESPWNTPGPSAGPFTVRLGDGSKLTYYWYRFIDQPSIIHANLPESMRQNLQNKIEMIHANWHSTDEYLPALTNGSLVGLDPGLIVSPPSGMEIGYVPIVTRQEKDTTVNLITPLASIDNDSRINIYPNPAKNQVRIEMNGEFISSVRLFNIQGKLVQSQVGLYQNSLTLLLEDQAPGTYILTLTDHNGNRSHHRIVKIVD